MHRAFTAMVPALLAMTATASAHPHVWVDAKADIVFDPQGRIAEIRHSWTFDEAFSAFAVQGLDTNNDGKYSREELRPLAEVNVTSLREYGYFTVLRVKSTDPNDIAEAYVRGAAPAGLKAKVAVAAPEDYWLEHDGTALTLHFTLPLKSPLPVGAGAVTLEVYDPEYFVAFSLAKDDPIRFTNAPEGCRLDVERPKELDYATATALAAIPAEVRQLPSGLSSLTGGLANRATIACGTR